MPVVFGTDPFPSSFESVLGVRVGEDGATTSVSLVFLVRVVLETARIPFCTLTFRHPMYAMSKNLCAFSFTMSLPFPLGAPGAGTPEAGFSSCSFLFLNFKYFWANCLAAHIHEGSLWNVVSCL